MSKCYLCANQCNKQTTAFSQCANRVRHNYEHYCNEYLRLFCQKHEFDYEDSKSSWVADAIGETVSVGDFYFSMTTIRTDIDRQALADELLKWYDYSIEVGTLGLPGCNFSSWLNGCPRISETELSRFRELHEKSREAEQLFHEAVRNYKETFHT